MDSTFQENRCPDCKEIPKRTTNGNLACDCKDKKWHGGCKGVPGTEKQRMRLAGKGFTEATDIRGDVYYVGPGNRILWVYSDGTWWVDPDDVSQGCTLEAYLQALPE